MSLKSFFWGNSLAGVEKELAKLSDVMVKLAEGTGRMNLIEDRQMAQGKRLDALTEAMMNDLRSRNVPSRPRPNQSISPGG